MADGRTGERIRAARRARGLTQQDLADAVGVSRSAVAQWETERAGQIRGNLSRIAAVLGVSLGFLVDGDDQTEAATHDSAELAMLRLFRECTEADRQLLLQTALHLVRKAS
jgi:transcriptional regulator with XRE-family HTH domain